MITLNKLRPYTGDVVAPSPNHSSREGHAIEGIVLHATADGGNEAGSLSWMRSPKSRASCHLLVGRDGKVVRMVGDLQRAWHAGGTQWRGKRDVNAVTLGIEIANRNDGEPYTDAQYGRVAAIVAHYCRQGLALKDVVGHGDIAGRAADPYGWDWERFRSMVLHMLRAEDIEGGPLVYDRRSAERRAADEAAASGSTDAPPPSTPMTRATPPGGVWVSAPPTGERRATPRAGERRVTPPSKPRVHAARKPKPVLRSRTVWLNGVTALAAGAVLVGDALHLAFAVGLTLPEEITKWALFAVGVVNIVLRLRTTQPISPCSLTPEPVPSDGTIRMPVRASAPSLGAAVAVAPR